MESVKDNVAHILALTALATMAARPTPAGARNAVVADEAALGQGLPGI
jgi:hypothetical protein